LNIARNVGRTAGQKAIDFASSKLTPKSQKILTKLVSSAPQKVSPQGPQQMTTSNLNNLIAGSGQRAIKIQDLVRRLNKQKITYNKWTFLT